MSLYPNSYHLQFSNGMTVEILGPSVKSMTVEATLRHGTKKLEEKIFDGEYDDELIIWLDIIRLRYIPSQEP